MVVMVILAIMVVIVVVMVAMVMMMAAYLRVCIRVSSSYRSHPINQQRVHLSTIDSADGGCGWERDYVHDGVCSCV